MSHVQTMSPTTMCERLGGGAAARLIDVRGIDEFAAVHVEGAECAPLPHLLSAASNWSRDEELMLICHSGHRATLAARQLAAAGFGRLAVVEGGTRACAKAGVPVVRGKATIPIERQVMICAGLAVLAGLGLAHVHPAFIAVSWIMSAGLVFAASTGICPMARVLAAAPWNKSGGETGATCGVTGGCS